MKRLTKLDVPNRIKQKDLPSIRNEIALSQGMLCQICFCDLSEKVACLDHDHSTGAIRGVLCLNCNQIEGKIKNLARRGRRGFGPRTFIENVIKYWDKHILNPDRRIHPSHLTEDEKRLRRNAKVRARRKSK